MPGSVATRKAICYIVFVSLTSHAHTAYLYLLAKQWYPDPATSSTTIFEEFVPEFLIQAPRLGHTVIPADDNLVKVLVFLLHFHLTMGCLGVYVLGVMFLSEMGLLSLWELWRRRRRVQRWVGGRRIPTSGVWARDPLDLMDRAKRTLFEKIVLAGAWLLFYIWIQLVVFLIIISLEWDIHHILKDDPDPPSRFSIADMWLGFIQKVLFGVLGTMVIVVLVVSMTIWVMTWPRA